MLALAALPAACGPERAGSPAATAVAAERRVAVLPFRLRGFLDSSGRFVNDPQAGAMPDDLGVYVAERLTTELAALGAHVVPENTVQQESPVAGAALYDIKLAVRVGRAVGAEAVAFGAVHRFVQREGTALSVERPASVQYQAMVVDVASGIVIGNFVFDYTQQPLASDLTALPDFIQGGGKWRTREEILDRSLTKTAGKIAGTLRTVAPKPAS